MSANETNETNETTETTKKTTRFNPEVLMPPKQPVYTDEHYAFAVEDFLTDDRYKMARSTMPIDLLLQEDQVVACKVADLFEIEVKGRVPVGLFEAARRICKENLDLIRQLNIMFPTSN